MSSESEGVDAGPLPGFEGPEKVRHQALRPCIFLATGHHAHFTSFLHPLLPPRMPPSQNLEIDFVPGREYLGLLGC